MKTDLLIQQLIDQTFKILDQGQKLNSFDLETLTWRPNESSWNILECIEHLNRYADYYLPEIREAIQILILHPIPISKAVGWGNILRRVCCQKISLTK